MQFCPKCGSVIIEKNCARCDYESEEIVKLEIVQQIKTKKEIPVIKQGENEINPVIDTPCPKCKNPQSFFWTKQTRASDEAETQFFKCTKCSYTWRRYR
ncbi:MAG: transcription factor S [Candidatus Pacearchaeota archaeon]